MGQAGSGGASTFNFRPKNWRCSGCCKLQQAGPRMCGIHLAFPSGAWVSRVWRDSYLECRDLASSALLMVGARLNLAETNFPAQPVTHLRKHRFFA